MGVISDAAQLPQLPDSTNTFGDVMNANGIAEEGLGNIRDMAEQEKQAKIAQAPIPKIVYKFNPQTGKYDVDLSMSADTFDFAGQLMKTGQATIDAFGQARAQLAAKREFQEKNPIISAVGKIASTAAAQYASGGRGRDISPIVRAAGAYGLEQFGQTNAELSQQEAQLTGQQFGVAKSLYDQQQQDEQIAISNKRADTAEDRNRIADERSQNQFEVSYLGQLRQQSSAGFLADANPEAVAEELFKSGAAKTPETAKLQAESLINQSKSALRIQDLREKARTDAAAAKELAVELRYQRHEARLERQFNEIQGDKQEGKTKKRAEMLTLAKGIIDGDETSYKVYSTRTGEQAEFLAVIKELDPDITAGVLNNRVKEFEALASETRGTSGSQLKSADVFIQHVGEVMPAFARLNPSDTRLLNTPINKIRKGVGSPELRDLLGAIAPVAKEYEFFLNNGFALQVSDREEVKNIIDGNATLGEARTVLQRFLKTTKDRYVGINNKFKRNVGRDLPEDALSPEARAAAASLGVPFPAGTPRTRGNAAPAPATGAAAGNPVARAPEGTPDGPIQYKGKPAVVQGGVIYAQ